jgi:hypothetical protein
MATSDFELNRSETVEDPQGVVEEAADDDVTPSRLHMAQDTALRAHLGWPLDDRPTMPVWYHTRSSRVIAETDLAAAPTGAYLVRKADSNVSSSTGAAAVAVRSHLYSLSVRVPEDARRAGTTVKHYQIHQHNPTGWFELANSLPRRPQFPDIRSLILSFGTIPPSRTDGVVLSSPCQSADTDDVEYVQLIDSPLNKLALDQARQMSDGALFRASTKPL